MRATVPVLFVCILGAAGCAPGDAGDFRYRSTFSTRTDGLILHEDGRAGHAGMYGTNCPFDTRTASVTGDYDLPGEGEVVQDGEPTELGEITIAAVIPGVVHVLDKTGGVYTHVPLEVPDVTDARLTVDGVVALTPECALSWVGFDGEVRQALSVPGCEGAGLEVDPLTATALVASPSGAALFDGAARTELPRAADLVAWDDVAEVFYVARRGDTWLAAVDRHGVEQWLVDLDGPVAAIDDAGGVGAVAAIVSLPSGRGLVELRDGATGVVTKAGETPSTAEDLSVAGDGSVIALVRPEQAFFFDIL